VPLLLADPGNMCFLETRVCPYSSLHLALFRYSVLEVQYYAVDCSLCIVHRSRVDRSKECKSWRQCMVSRAGLVFLTTQRENIHPAKKEMNKTVTMQSKLPDVCS
jgi:hypothetical protein